MTRDENWQFKFLVVSLKDIKVRMLPTNVIRIYAGPFPAASCSEISILCVGCVLRSQQCSRTPGGRGHPPRPLRMTVHFSVCVYIFTLGDRWECARGEKCEIQLESRSTLSGPCTHSPIAPGANRPHTPPTDSLCDGPRLGLTLIPRLLQHSIDVSTAEDCNSAIALLRGG